MTNYRETLRANSRSLLVGGMIGVDHIAHSLAMASILFVGALEPGLAIGVNLFLASTILITFAFLVFRPFAGACGLAQDTTIPILAAGVVATLGSLQGASPTALFATVLAIIAITTFGSGLGFFIAGRLKLSAYFKLIPYPVLAGFMAGTGWLFIFGAASMITGKTGLGDIASTLFKPGYGMNVAITLLLALMMTWLDITKLIANGALVLLLIAIAVFFLTLAVTGVDLTTARELGFLKSATLTPDAKSDPIHYGPGLFREIMWPQVWSAAPTIGAAVVLNFIAFGFNHSGAEIAIKRRINTDKAFQTTGILNMILSPFAGLTSFLAIGVSLVASKFNASDPYLAIGRLALLIPGVLAAGLIVSTIPKFAAAALLTYLGFILITDWLYLTFYRLDRGEWSLTFAIFVATILFGFLPALLLGLLFSVFLFVVTYARIGIIASVKNGLEVHSRVQRSADLQALLSHSARRIHVVELRGFIFFGSAETLQLRLENLVARDLAETGTTPTHFVLDCSDVLGLDATACQTFSATRDWALRNNIKVIFANLSDKAKLRVEQASIQLPNYTFGSGAQPTGHSRQRQPNSSFGLFSALDLDRALEACENSLLSEEISDNEPSDQFQNRAASLPLANKAGEPWKRILEQHELQKFPAGTYVIEQGSSGKDIFLIASGRVEIRSGSDEKARRLISFEQGSLFGDMAYYLGLSRTASAIALTDSYLYIFKEADIAKMEQRQPELALEFHKFVATTLAQKLHHTTFS